MNWGHRVPFENQPEEGDTVYRLRVRVNDLIAEVNRLRERNANLEGELHHYKRKAGRRWWRR